MMNEGALLAGNVSLWVIRLYSLPYLPCLIAHHVYQAARAGHGMECNPVMGVHKHHERFPVLLQCGNPELSASIYKRACIQYPFRFSALIAWRVQLPQPARFTDDFGHIRRPTGEIVVGSGVTFQPALQGVKGGWIANVVVVIPAYL